MSNASRVIATVTAAGLLGMACTKVPYTNRKQFNLVPEGMMNNIGQSSYAEVLSTVSVQRKTEDVKTLKEVGGRISKQADKPEYDWSYALIESEEINAWCMPGGYIGFYTGILPVLGSEAGMSFVMGHEVGHAVAKHGAERMSQNLGVMGGLAVVDLFLSGSGKVTEEQRGMIMAAAGMGAQYGVLLPFSRTHEKEADVIGMMYMAGAGYAPQESIDVWNRMESLTGGSPPAFLSTHPTFENRRENQVEWMGEAKKRYRRNKLPDSTRQIQWTVGG